MLNNIVGSKTSFNTVVLTPNKLIIFSMNTAVIHRPACCFTSFRRQKTNKPSMIKLKTTEEMEMECIAKLRKQTKHHIKANENSMKKAILCPAVNAVRAGGTSLTRPHEFHFQTDKRVKQHPMATRADQQQQHNLNGEDCEKEFWNSLRQHPPSPVRIAYTASIIIILD